MVDCALEATRPMLLKAILSALEADTAESSAIALYYTLGMFAVSVLIAMAHTHFMVVGKLEVGLRVQTAAASLVYEKLLETHVVHQGGEAGGEAGKQRPAAAHDEVNLVRGCGLPAAVVPRGACYGLGHTV